MQFSPSQKNSSLVNTIITLSLIFGGVAYAVPVICDARGIAYMPWLFSLLTLSSVVTALYFLVRYKMSGFIYIIRPRSDIETDPTLEAAYAGSMDVSRVSPEWLDLVVMKSQGSRQPVTECVLSFGDLAAVIPVVRDRKTGTTPADVAKKYRERAATDFVFYDYTLSYRWENALELVFVDGQRYVGVILEADEALESVLRSISRLGK